MMSFNHFNVVTLIGKSGKLFALSVQLQTAKQLNLQKRS